MKDVEPGRSLEVVRGRTHNPLWAKRTPSGVGWSQVWLDAQPPSLGSGLWLTLLVTFLGSAWWRGSCPHLSRYRSGRTWRALFPSCSDKALGLVLMGPHCVARVTCMAQESSVLMGLGPGHMLAPQRVQFHSQHVG